MHSESEQMKKLFDVPTAGSWRQNTFWTMECTEIQVGHTGYRVHNLRKICTLEEIRRIDVINLDAWVAQFLREHGYAAEIVYDEKVTKIWEDAVVANDFDSEFPVSFYALCSDGRGWL